MSRDGWAKKRANASDDNGWAERGGYMAAKVSKLDAQFKLDAPTEKRKDGSYSNIFSGVSIFVNGYTEPSADELRRLMMLHGGHFHVYYSRSKTTHIITNNLPNFKIQQLNGEKIIRPQWISDSITAGRLLPHHQYQLYTKVKGPLFPGPTLRQAPETAGPSHGLLRPSVHPKLHVAQRGLQPPAGEHEGSSPGCHNTSVPDASHSPLHHGNDQPQSLQPSAAVGFVPPPPSDSPPTVLHAEPRHRRVLSEPSPSKPPQSPLQAPHAHLQRHTAYQPQPQNNSSCNTVHSGYKEVDSKRNGLLQTSLESISHSKVNEMQECGEGDPLPQEVKGARLTNGHTRLVNGALKPEDRPSATGEPSVDESPEEEPQSPPVPVQTKPDPYEFPHSPPKQSDSSPVSLKQSNSHGADEPRAKPPPPAHHEATGTQNHPLQPPRGDGPRPDAPRSLSRSPLRLNGSHHNALSSDPASLHTTNVRAEPHAPAQKASSPSKSPAQLLSRTGSLISEYYSHSRLHQISTWRSGFSEYVNELHGERKAAAGDSFPGRERLRRHVAHHSTDGPGTTTPACLKSCILHVDMDCFFVSVGIRHRPELKGRPVAVTSSRGQGSVPLRPGAQPQLEQQYYQRKHHHPTPDEDPHRSPSQESPDSHPNGVDQEGATLSLAEIASCSYEARQAGVRNGMFFGRAKQLCPSLQSVPYDFEAYKEVALTMYETLAGYTHDIEALSCDEVLIDGSALLAELSVRPEELADAIRADIKEKTGCCASVGMGSNILLARLATRKAKPDGQHLLKPEEVDDFIRELPVTSLPGVGPVMGRKLSATGVRSCGDLQQVSLTQLQKKFGPRTGQTLFRFSRGLDERPVRYGKEKKSVSAEMNYNIRFTGVDEAESFLTNLSMEVQKRLQEAGLRGRRVTLKVMVRKAGAPLESAKYGGHGICDNLARTVMLAQSTDSGQLIAAAVIKLLHAMKLQVQEMRGVGIQVQLLDGRPSAPQDSAGPGTRSIKELLRGRGSSGRSSSRGPSSVSSSRPRSSPEPVPGTSRDQQACSRTPKHSGARLNFSIEIPSPSQVDRSVLEALPVELREQVERSWSDREGRASHRQSPSPLASAPLPQPSSPRARPASPPPPPALYAPPVGTLLLQIPNQPDGLGIVLELPSFSQVDPDVFAALPKELQAELKSAYNRVTNVQPQEKTLDQKNPLLQLKQSGIGLVLGRVKRRYKKKNAASPVKKAPSPLKRRRAGNSPGRTLPPSKKSREHVNIPRAEHGPSTSTSRPDLPEPLARFIPRPAPVLAGAFDLTDIRTLLREWVTTITDPMEEDILQVVKYCTDLIEDKDLEKLDLIIKYMKRLMQQSVESVWSMAFDFILDNVQVVVQQAYGSTLKVA